MNLKRVLFVDDEPNVLEGLQRMLRSMRDEWTMEFAESGTIALSEMSMRPFDVVISDMRMPGMDGAQLLSEVKRLYPGTVRIVLSGQSDHELIMKTVGLAHQYISKPCDPQQLKDTVNRACALRDILTDQNLQLLVSQMQSLPSVPAIYSELMDEIASVDVSIKRVGEIISKDPAMTAKILQLINSAFFGLRRHISNPSDATALLGLDTVSALVLSAQVFEEFNNARIPEFSMEQIWSHSSKVATTARAIARSTRQSTEIGEQSFAAGLLHDVGRLVLAAKLPERYSEALTLAKTESISIYEAENTIFGTAHPEVGAYLLGIWGLPDAIVEAVAFHHMPIRCSKGQFSALTAVYLANHLEPVTASHAATPLDTSYLSDLGLLDQLGAFEEIRRKIFGTEDESS